MGGYAADDYRLQATCLRTSYAADICLLGVLVHVNGQAPVARTGGAPALQGPMALEMSFRLARCAAALRALLRFCLRPSWKKNKYHGVTIYKLDYSQPIPRRLRDPAAA